MVLVQRWFSGKKVKVIASFYVGGTLSAIFGINYPVKVFGSASKAEVGRAMTGRHLVAVSVAIFDRKASGEEEM